MQVQLNTVGQSIDFICFLIILIVCRPRKAWPPFFSLGINEMDFGRERGANGQVSRRPPPPFMKGEITHNLLFDNYD